MKTVFGLQLTAKGLDLGILTAYSLGIDNMLLLTGDHASLGDHKDARNVFDLD